MTTLSTGFYAQALELTEKAQDELKKGKVDSADYYFRSAVSRFYFASFHHTKDYLKAHPASPNDGELKFTGEYTDHRKALNQLMHPSVGKEDAKDNLKRLRTLRNKCDYQERVRNIALVNTSAKMHADEIIESLK